VLPSLVRTGGMLIGISTGYRRLGLLYTKWRDHYGQDGNDVLVVQGDSVTFNPTLDYASVERAKAADPEAAISEWEGGFRTDLAAFLDDATIDAAIDYARPLELPPRPNAHHHVAFTDVSGGRHDHFSLVIGHREGETLVADVVTGRAPPFDPHNVVADYARLLREYGVGVLVGDNYSAGWADRAWRDCGVQFKRSELNKSQLYLESLPLWMRGAIRIPDHARLLRELRLLERRVSPLGRDIVDHPRNNGSDDYSNALAGMLSLISRANRCLHLLDPTVLPLWPERERAAA